MPVRCKEEKEYDLMLPESNRLNIERFEELLPYFFYTDDSIDRIMEAVRGELEYSMYIDELLRLNNQRRAFFKVTKNATTDEGYLLFRQTLISTFNRTGAPTPSEFTTYEAFINNKTVYEKQEVKVFKWLMKNGFLTKEEAESISNIKTSNELYICVSRNPIDFLFCSTDQSYSSCLDLESSYEAAYYMGLGGLPLDPNRVIIFLTKGKIKRYTIHNLEFKHFTYIQRTWGLLNELDQICIVNDYPSRSIDFANELNRDLPFSNYGYNLNRSKFSFVPIEYEDESGPNLTIYLDNIGTEWISGEEIEYTRYGSTGVGIHFHWTDGFETMPSFEEVRGDGYRCTNCGDPISEETTYSNENGQLYCEYCYNDIYSNCQHCQCECVYDDMRQDEVGYSYCADCFEELFGVCSDCGAIIPRDDEWIGADGGVYCEDCFNDNFFYCENCQEVYNKEDNHIGTDQRAYCPDCFDTLYTYCEECGEFVDRDNATERHGKFYCGNCISIVTKEESCKD